MLEELIEGANSDKAAWGCDTWTPEESYAALLALRHVLARTLSGRIANGYFDQQAAEFLIDNILYHNPSQLYGLHDHPEQSLASRSRKTCEVWNPLHEAV